MPRGRPKGSKNKIIEVDVRSEGEEQVKKAAIKIQNKLNSSNSVPNGPAKFKRDENGLLESVDYHFNDDGSVNWRAMVKDEHLFPNKSWFESRKKDVPRNIDGLKDHQLLIKLSGIKELARLRGFSSINYNSVKCEKDHVAVSCSIAFLANYETNNQSVFYEDMANATFENTSSFATKFLETIACNRAFVRCVRNFLNIHIVGDDEIDKSGIAPARNQSSGISLSPQGALKVQAELNGFFDFDTFKNHLRKLHKEGVYEIDSSANPSEWSSFEDIPPKQARELIKIIKGS